MNKVSKKLIDFELQGIAAKVFALGLNSLIHKCKKMKSSVFVFSIFAFLFCFPNSAGADVGYIHWPGTPYSPVWSRLYYDYQQVEKNKPIEFTLLYAPRKIDSTPVKIEATVSTFGGLSVPLPEKWEKVFNEKGEQDRIKFSVAPPDNDTVGFKIEFIVGADTTNAYMTIVTATKATYFYPRNPKWLNVDPAEYYSTEEAYFKAMEQVVDSAEKHPEDESLQLEAKKAREAFGNLTIIPGPPEPKYVPDEGHLIFSSPTLEERQVSTKRGLEREPLTDSLFEILDVKDIRYIRFKGEADFSVLDVGRSKAPINTRDGQTVFLRLSTNADIRVVAKIVQRIPSYRVSGNYPSEVLGTYRLQVSSETVKALQDAGVELITNQEYHQLFFDYEPPLDD